MNTIDCFGYRSTDVDRFLKQRPLSTRVVTEPDGTIYIQYGKLNGKNPIHKIERCTDGTVLRTWGVGEWENRKNINYIYSVLDTVTIE